MDSGQDNTDDPEMHRDVSWLNPSDRPILQELADVDGRWQKPATMALNLGYSRYTIAQRLKLLADKGLAERKDENTPAYRITDLGKQFLRNELDKDDLETLTS